jgi:ABC-type polysaccharide/polyol phosphate transport system ATPase subunit
MTWIDVENVTIDIPVLDSHSVSLKNRAAAILRRRVSGSREPSQQQFIRALENISFSLAEGDRVGLIGKNGSGKTTLLRVLAGIYEPMQGQVRLSGRTSALLDLTFGIDMEATGIENIFLRGYALGMTKTMIKKAESVIVEFTELGQRLQHPVRTYSAGMILRLAFSISLMSPHEIMLIDEIIGVGDASFIGKTRGKLESALAQSRIVVVASHAIDLIESICNKAIYLHEGRIVSFGPVADVVSAFKHEISAGSH